LRLPKRKKTKTKKNQCFVFLLNKINTGQARPAFSGINLAGYDNSGAEAGIINIFFFQLRFCFNPAK
jgi:hypothetical protein